MEPPLHGARVTEPAPGAGAMPVLMGPGARRGTAGETAREGAPAVPRVENGAPVQDIGTPVAVRTTLMVARIDIEPEQVQAAERPAVRAGRNTETEGETGRRGARPVVDDGAREGREAREIVRDTVAAAVTVAAAMVGSPCPSYARAHEVGAVPEAAGAVRGVATRPSRLVAEHGSGRLGSVRLHEAAAVAATPPADGAMEGSRAVPATRVPERRQVERAPSLVLIRRRARPDRRARPCVSAVGLD